MKKTIVFLALLSFGWINLVAETENKYDTLNLNIAPSSWGAGIKGSSGVIKYYSEYKKYFMGEIIVKGLKPNHNYLVTLDSKPDGTGGENLSQKHSNGKHLDFLQFKTDDKGNCTAKFKRKLKAGDYDVKIFVKDESGFQVVLYNNYLLFEIKK